MFKPLNLSFEVVKLLSLKISSIVDLCSISSLVLQVASSTKPLTYYKLEFQHFSLPVLTISWHRRQPMMHEVIHRVHRSPLGCPRSTLWGTIHFFHLLHILLSMSVYDQPCLHKHNIPRVRTLTSTKAPHCIKQLGCGYRLASFPPITNVNSSIWSNYASSLLTMLPIKLHDPMVLLHPTCLPSLDQCPSRPHLQCPQWLTTHPMLLCTNINALLA